MRRFREGDSVRVDIPDETDPDHDRLHGENGTVSDVLRDDAPRETGDERDAYLFRVELDSGGVEDLRWRDLRPAPES
ncbi:hypothetical protein [Halolamina salifodinae]|uniref:hypothetical protein n=1 Tax=Halolamina salifodinae TaxID=1202767 RepID=UPI0031F33240